MNSRLVAIIAAALCLGSAQAKADYFLWSYTNSSGFGAHGEGVLTTAGTKPDGGLIITGAIGTYNGFMLGGGGTGVIYYSSETSETPFLESFTFTASYWQFIYPTTVYITWKPDEQQYRVIEDHVIGVGFRSGGEFTLTPTYSGVPGPLAGAGIPGLILACSGLLGWMRRRNKKEPPSLEG